MLHLQPLGAAQQILRIRPLGDAAPASPRAPTQDELTAKARTDAAALAREEGRPEVARVIESGDASSLQATIAGGVAIGAGAAAYAACMAPFVAAAGAAGGAGAAAPIAAHFLCGAAGTLAGSSAAWLVMNADEAAEWVGEQFSADESSYPSRTLDASTGSLRQKDIPSSMSALPRDRSTAFRADSGPFEGVWRLTAIPKRGEWGPTGQFPVNVRLYDRGGWVMGPVVRTHTGAMTANFLFRRSGNSARGRFWWGDRNIWYPWIFEITGDGSLTGTLPDTGQQITGVRIEAPPRPAPRQERESRREPGRPAKTAAGRPWLLYGLLGLGAAAVVVGLATAGKR